MTHSTHPVPIPNLLPQSRITNRRREHALRHWSFALLALILVIALPSAMLSIHLRATNPTDTDHVTRFVSDLEQLQAVIPPLKKQLAQLESDSKSQKIAENRIQWTSVLDLLASLTDEHVRIHSFTASIQDSSPQQRIELTIQIHTDSLSQAREFLVTLEAVGLFDDLNMLDSRRQSSNPDSPVNSTIRAQILAEQSTEGTP